MEKQVTYTAEKLQEELNLIFSELATLKTVFDSQVEVMLLCAGKEIKDEIVYNILTLSLEAVVIKISRLNETLIKILNKSQATIPKLFGPSRMTQYLTEVRANDRFLFQILKPIYNETLLRIFPKSANWTRAIPSFNDFDELKNKIISWSREIKEYRDKELAHQDEKELVLEIEIITNYFNEMEKMLSDLYLIIFLSSRKFSFKNSHSHKDSAKKIADACLS